MNSRFCYVKYDETTALIQADFKKGFVNLDTFVEALPNSRAKAHAVTKLEEAYMWVGKALRDLQISRDPFSELLEERKDG